jgi:hypothetical protein
LSPDVQNDVRMAMESSWWVSGVLLGEPPKRPESALLGAFLRLLVGSSHLAGGARGSIASPKARGVSYASLVERLIDLLMCKLVVRVWSRQLTSVRSKHSLVGGGSLALNRANTVGRRFAYRACVRASWKPVLKVVKEEPPRSNRARGRRSTSKTKIWRNVY